MLKGQELACAVCYSLRNVIENGKCLRYIRFVDAGLIKPDQKCPIYDILDDDLQKIVLGYDNLEAPAISRRIMEHAPAEKR